MGSCSLYSVVVIYNKQCEDSSTCKCLQRIKGTDVIVVDNSTQDNDNETFAKENSWTYILMGGNMGLSKAYNCAIEKIQNQNAILCLFDDDSQVDEDYFVCLEKTALHEKTSKVFMPCIYDGHGLMSPSIIKGVSVRRADSVDKIPFSKITGVNTGMAIRRDIFNSYRYDEEYFLDCIDHAFLRDMRARNIKISVLNTKLHNQSLFETPDADIDKIINRFTIFKKDFKRFCGSSLKGWFGYYKEISRYKYFFFTKYNRKWKFFFI